MTEWLINNPVIFGLITAFLMFIDWGLTIRSEIIYGVTIAGFTSAFRQIIWLRKVSLIDKNDLPPELEISRNEN